MNVIVIMEDSFRKDHFGCYGNPWIKTPMIDSFAEQSTVFDFAYAEGLPTVPVRSSLFTGRYTLPFRGWQPLVQNDVLLAELLWNRGYTSAFIGDTYHMGKPEMAFSRGFDYFRMIRGQSIDHWKIDSSIKVNLNQYSERNWASVWPGVPISVMKRIFSQYLRNRSDWKSEEDHHIARVVTQANSWLEKKVSEGTRDKIFLWIDSFDPHEPWDPPTKYTDMYPVPDYNDKPNIWGGGQNSTFTLDQIRNTRSQYAGTISLVDRWTGILLNKISDLGLLDNTMIIFLSDHGEPLGEHGIVQKVQPWPYEELSHIPLIIRMPDGMANVPRASKFAGMPDIAPTILDFLKEPIPQEMQGQSLLPVVENNQGGMSFGVAGFFGRSWSIRNQDTSFYLFSSFDDAKNEWVKTQKELYHFDYQYVPTPPAKYNPGDQAEKENLIEKDSKLANHLEKQLQNFLDALKPSLGDALSQEYRQRVSATGKSREMDSTPAYSSLKSQK